MRSKADVENRYLLKYADYLDVEANLLRMTDNFALCRGIMLPSA